MGIGKQAKILTTKQQELIIKHLETTRHPLRNQVMFGLSFKAGLRAKEISNLTWSMLCNSSGELGLEINITNKASKGKNSGRIIPIHKELHALLSKFLIITMQKSRFSLEKHIIYTERDKKTSSQAIVNWFSNLYKEVGFDGCSSHSGRRTFITNAAKNISFIGGTLNDVKLLAGHSSLTTTQRYNEYNTEAHKKLVEMI